MRAVYWYRFQSPRLADVQHKGTVPPKNKRKPRGCGKDKTTGERGVRDEDCDSLTVTDMLEHPVGLADEEAHEDMISATHHVTISG